jgi:NAD+ synthase/NAD+ synthase (glutamine-hydrolysing)
MRVALAQINPIVGDLTHNGRLIERAIAAAREGGADLVVLPELALCGYPPKDLLLREGFLAACVRESRRVGESATAGITAVFGTPLPRSGDPDKPGGICNSLVVYADNAYVGYYDKRLLPTYDVFDEDRYFVAGDEAVVVPVESRSGRAGGGGGGGVDGGGGGGGGGRVWRVGLSVCEDLWQGEDAGFAQRYTDRADPVAALVDAGAELIVNPSASPFVLGKGLRHRRIVQGKAKAFGVPVLAVNQVGGNDELIFDGHAVAFDAAGTLLAAGPGFVEAITMVDVPDGPGAGGGATGGAGVNAGAAGVRDLLLLTSAEELAFRAVTLGVRDYLRKTGFTRAVLGLSGGIDSALTATIAACALGASNVLGVAMPGPYSSAHSVEDAYELAARLGMRCITVPVTGVVDASRGELDRAFAALDEAALGATLPDLAEENLQSRIRGTTIMAISNRTGAMVLTTGNKSEMAVGYCTLYGDMNGGLAVLADASKQLVYALSRWVNEHYAAVGLASAPIPTRTLTKAPSAELRPNQTDQDSLPPYEVLDRILDLYVEGQRSIAGIQRETGYDRATIERVARLVDTSEFKRKQAAIGLKLTSVAFGSGRRMPIAQRWRSP